MPNDRHQDLALLPIAAGFALTIAAASLVLPADGRLRAALPFVPTRGSRVAADWTSFAVQPEELVARALDSMMLWTALLIVGAALIGVATSSALISASGVRLRHESAVKAGLGASPARLTREMSRRRTWPLLSRSLLVGGVAGAVLALMLRIAWPIREAHWGTAVLAVIPSIALVVLAIAALVGLITLAPAWSAGDGMRRLAGAAWSSPVRSDGFLREMAAGFQLCVSLVLVSSASILLSAPSNRGMSSGTADGNQGLPDGVMVAIAPAAHLGDAERAAAYRRVLAGLDPYGTPSVQSAGALLDLGTVDLTVGPCGPRGEGCPTGMAPLLLKPVDARHHMVSRGTFDTVGLVPLAGRLLEDTDDWNAPKVAVVSRSYVWALAKEPAQMVGERIRVGREWLTVVGVVGDRESNVLGRPAGAYPTVYLSVLQHPPERVDLTALGTRTSSLEEIRRAIRASGLTIESEPTTLSENRARAAAPLVWSSTVMLSAALIALVLALIGVVRVSRLEVASRTRELAIRAGLGASPRRLQIYFAWRIARLVMISSIIAIPLITAVSTALRDTVGELPIFQPGVYAMLVAGLVIASVGGSLSAAVEAGRVAPRQAMSA